MQNGGPFYGESFLQALPAVRPLGRHTFTGGALNLFYTASGFECIFTGSELHLCLRAGASAHEPWISVLLNGAWIARFRWRRAKAKSACSAA